MKVKIKTEDENFVQYNNSVGKLLGTFTKNNEQYVTVKFETESIEVPRKFCEILLGKPLTEALK